MLGFLGYTIPKGTIIYPVCRYMMRDPEYWKKPEEFIPERFLETNKQGGQYLTKEERLIPFGLGKTCILWHQLNLVA